MDPNATLPNGACIERVDALEDPAKFSDKHLTPRCDTIPKMG